jgi:putative tryptophan/tyrosine transport system substrate-binding protein
VVERKRNQEAWGSHGLAFRVSLLTLALLAAIATLACSVSFSSSQPRVKPHRIGLLSSRAQQPWYQSLTDGMIELSYIQGQDFLVEPRYADGDADLLQQLLRELVGLPVDVIVVTDAVALTAARNTSPAPPIVMALGGDPVASGAVASMSHPGGNVTGLASMTFSVAGKRIALLQEILPGFHRLGVLRNPDNLARAADWPGIVAASDAAGVELIELPFRAPADLDQAFERAAQGHVDAIHVIGEPMIAVERNRVAQLAAAYRIPLMFERGDLIESGGLISYGVPLGEVYRRAATFVDRIIKGARPADLPIEVPTRFELMINLRTAEELGLTLPAPLLTQADRLVQ